MRFFSRTSLATRLSALVILTTIPLFVLSILNYFDLREQRRETGIAEARAYIRNLSTLLNSGATDIDSFMSAAAIGMGSQPQEINSANTSQYLARLQTNYPNLNSLFIADLNGRVIAQASGQDTGFDVSNRPYLLNLKRGSPKTWTTQPGLRSGELVTAYGRVIPAPDNSPRGYLIASFKSQDALANKPKDFPADGNLFIVDGDGKLILSYDEPDVSVGPRDVREDPLMIRALNGEAIDIKDSTTAYDSGKRYGSVLPVPQLGWVIGYTRSQDLLDSEARDRFIRDLGLLVAVTGATVVAVIILSRLMVRPLSRLAAVADDITAGRRVNVTTSIADPDVRKLESAFATMSTAVADREDQLREQAEVLSDLYAESERVQEQLRESNAAKDEFLGLVSHELRTPTTTIYGGIRMLESRRDLLGPEATGELIHTMSEETERLVRLIENLLVFARLELGRMPDREPLSVNQLVEQVATNFGRTHRSRQIETDLAASLPPVLGQGTSIEQVLMNFLSNADKYSPAGEPVTVITRLAGDEVEVLVRDRGSGVPADDLAKIFDSFFRSADATKRATGHGLGLSVSKRIVDAHEGRIFAHNHPDGGFEIGFALPLADLLASGDAPSESSQTAAVGGSA